MTPTTEHGQPAQTPGELQVIDGWAVLRTREEWDQMSAWREFNPPKSWPVAAMVVQDENGDDWAVVQPLSTVAALHAEMLPLGTRLATVVNVGPQPMAPIDFEED